MKNRLAILILGFFISAHCYTPEQCEARTICGSCYACNASFGNDCTGNEKCENTRIFVCLQSVEELKSIRKDCQRNKIRFAITGVP